MIDIEHPAYSLVKLMGPRLGYSPNEGESWATIVGDPHQVWGPVNSVDQAQGIAEVLMDFGVAIGESAKLQETSNATLMAAVVLLTQHSLRLAEFQKP